METKTLAPELFQQLLEHSYLIVSDARTKSIFFKQEDRRASSTLILVDLIKNWGHPATCANFNNQKKGRPANNLLLLLSDVSWNQKIVTWEGQKFKSYDDWGAHATHVSDLICFRDSFYKNYSYTKLEEMCYDQDIEKYISMEYWKIVS